ARKTGMTLICRRREPHGLLCTQTSEKDQWNTGLFRSNALSWLFTDSIRLGHGPVPESKSNILRASEGLSHRQCQQNQSACENDGRETPPSVSVLDGSHSKGRSGAENGRGRGNQTRTGLHFFGTGTVPDFFLQV